MSIELRIERYTTEEKVDVVQVRTLDTPDTDKVWFSYNVKHNGLYIKLNVLCENDNETADWICENFINHEYKDEKIEVKPIKYAVFTAWVEE